MLYSFVYVIFCVMLCVFAFLFGFRAGVRVRKGDERIVEVPKGKGFQARKREKEEEKKLARLNVILDNINSYDGSERGQKVIR